MDVDDAPSTPGKWKMEKPHHRHHPRLLLPRWHHSYPVSKLVFWSFFSLALFLALFLLSPRSSGPARIPESFASSSSSSGDRRAALQMAPGAARVGEARAVVRPGAAKPGGASVLVTGAAFVGMHVAAASSAAATASSALTTLMRARQALLDRAGVFVVEGDIDDGALLRKLFDVVPFTHVVHLAAQAGVRHALVDPASYVHSNVAGLVSVLEAAKAADPQPAIVWASSSSVYGLNSCAILGSRPHRPPGVLYAATKKAGEIAHVYNHIYGLSITGLRFFTVYGPWGRPDMAYFFFTRDILRGKPVSIFEGPDHATVARCLAALDHAGRAPAAAASVGRHPIYDLGNACPVPVTKLDSILERLLKVKAVKKFVKMPRNGDVQFTHANITFAQKELGYRPTTGLHSGLKKFVRWYLEYYSISLSKNDSTGRSISS
ncbi:NAD dependent epimerase/dehydratase family [Musa troglodytarum]|uniref:NAD dependent epimerase/dehydratase family n=1 Tax=Musa troglodytarum TaxID=320322 RepID=A0A9E7G655_9LILI|nr:NAD dependent epimerase/dehydratase family [Musa troglodytarum]